MVDRLYSKFVFDSIMPPTDDKREDFSEINNCTNLRFKLNGFRQNSQLCDITIKVDLNGLERSFNCHKVILAAASPYFEAMFCRGFKEARSGEVTINEVDPKLFSNLLDYIYTEEIQINEENVEKLMIANSMFQIFGLEKLCSNFLESKLEISNCFEFATFAENYGRMEILTKINKFIGKNFMEISQTEVFKVQADTVISKLISKNELHVVCESQVFNAVLEWIKYDLTSRKQCLKKLINNVRCHLIKPNFISIKLENCEIIKDTCYEYLSKVLDDLKAYNPIESKQRQLDIRQVIYIINISYRSDEKSLESVEFRLSETDVWFKLPKICLSRISKSVVINGFIYMLKRNGDMERYNPISNKWKKCKSLDEELCLPRIEVIDNELYLFHGGKETKLMKYDPITDEWTQRASLRRGYWFDCAVFNRILYVVGGYVFGESATRVDKYDPPRDEWTSVKSLLTPRSDLAVVTLGNYIYAIGGYNDGGDLKTVERYDVLNDNWEFVASMKYAREDPKAVVFNKKIYVFGGFGGREDYGIVECYNEVTNEWKEVARTNEWIDQVIVSYQPCVPDICENFHDICENK